MSRSKALRFGSAVSAAAVAGLLAAGCGSTAGTTAAPAAKSPAAAGGAAPAPTAPSSAPAGDTGSAPAAGTASSGSAPAPAPGGSPSAPHAPAALPASAKGDHQKVVDLMPMMGTSRLPIHKTASLGAAAKVYQVAAAKYPTLLSSLSATGYGDAESSANTYILILGQLKPVAPLPDVAGEILAAMGAHDVAPQTSLGGHAAASSLVMDCGNLASGYSICVWMGGTGGDLYMGAFEAPPGTGITETEKLTESAFMYVAP